MTAPMSDKRLEGCRRASKYSAVGRALVAEVDRLREELAEMERDRDKWLESASMACEGEGCGDCEGCQYAEERQGVPS